VSEEREARKRIRLKKQRNLRRLIREKGSQREKTKKKRLHQSQLLPSNTKEFLVLFKSSTVR
jgi:hypothetical protein